MNLSCLGDVHFNVSIKIVVLDRCRELAPVIMRKREVWTMPKRKQTREHYELYAMTIGEIAEELGLSRTRVFKIEEAALTKLRHGFRRTMLESEASTRPSHPEVPSKSNDRKFFKGVSEYWPELLLK